MRIVRQTVLAGLLALAAPWGVTMARAETLADSLAAGYESSGVLEQNRAVLRAADEDVAQAVAALRPVVSFVTSFQAANPGSPLARNSVAGFSGGTTLGLRASLTLYDFGRRELLIAQQKEAVLATRQALLDVEQQVLLRVAQAYLEVRRSAAFVGLRQNNVRLISEELRAAQDRFEVGEVTRTDVALAESSLAAARSALSAEEGGLVQAREEFRAAVGRLPGDLAPAPPARIPYTLDQATEVALRTRPNLLQAQHQVAQAEIAVAATEATLRPSIAATGGFQLDQDLDDSASSIGLELSAPIYQGGAGASTVRQAQAQRDSSRASLLTVARDVRQDVANAFSAIEVARASQQAFEQQVVAADIAFSGVREEATLGARTTLDVLDAEQELLNARANLVSSQVDESVASYQLLTAMGLMTAQNLGLAVQVYDPTAYYDLVDDAPAARSERGEALDRVLQSIAR